MPFLFCIAIKPVKPSYHLFYGALKVFISRVETIDGSANEGEDYIAVNEILTFEPYETEKEVKMATYGST